MAVRRTSALARRQERRFSIEALERRDCPAVVSITGPAEVYEAGSPVTLLATLSEPLPRPLTVPYSIVGSARNGADYGLSIGSQLLRTAGSFVFPAGTTSLPITFTPRNDTAREGNETFQFMLGAIRGHTLGSRSAAITLVDDDSYTASLTGPARVARNASNPFRLELSSPATRQEVFFISTEDRSAGTPGDYAGLRNVPVMFQPGQRVREFRITTTAGSGPDRDETFAITARARSLDIPAVTPFIVTIEGSGQPGPTPGPPFTDATFTHTYGWGIVNAAAAVSKVIGGTTAFPEVPQLGGVNWGNDMVRAPEVWAQGYTGQGIVVAVVDTGVDYNHPSLRDKIWVNAREIPGDGIDNDNNGFVDDVRGWDFYGNDNDPMDDDGHGTHVAGTIAAIGSQFGPRGVATDARIMPVRTHEFMGYPSVLAAAIRYATTNGAHVINMSLGEFPSREVSDAVAFATSRGSVVVVAAGNDREFSPSFPASLANSAGVISVGAVNDRLQLAEFSSYAGFSPALKHVVAPGENVTSTVPAGFPGGQVTSAGTFASEDGTSMAAPHVAGVVALMLSAVPNPKAQGVRDRVVDALRSTSQQPPPLTAQAPASRAAGSAATSGIIRPLVASAAAMPVTTITATVAAAAAPSPARPQPAARPVVMPRVVAPANAAEKVAAFATLEADRSRRTEPTRPTRIEAPVIAMRQLAASRLPRGLDVARAF
ncbi:MAG: S8 family serine peptidase [Planctomycetota bacterium]